MLRAAARVVWSTAVPTAVSRVLRSTGMPAVVPALSLVDARSPPQTVPVAPQQDPGRAQQRTGRAWPRRLRRTVWIGPVMLTVRIALMVRIVLTTQVEPSRTPRSPRQHIHRLWQPHHPRAVGPFHRQ